MIRIPFHNVSIMYIEVWEPQTPEILRACPGLLWCCFYIYFVKKVFYVWAEIYRYMFKKHIHIYIYIYIYTHTHTHTHTHTYIYIYIYIYTYTYIGARCSAVG